MQNEDPERASGWVGSGLQAAKVSPRKGGQRRYKIVFKMGKVWRDFLLAVHKCLSAFMVSLNLMAM